MQADTRWQHSAVAVLQEQRVSDNVLGALAAAQLLAGSFHGSGPDNELPKTRQLRTQTPRQNRTHLATSGAVGALRKGSNSLLLISGWGGKDCIWSTRRPLRRCDLSDYS